MPHLSGQELIRLIKDKFPEIPVIVVTAMNKVSAAVECMKLGAFDYMVKPVDDNRLLSGLKNAIELGELHNENSSLKQKMLAQQPGHADAFSRIVTVSDSMRAIFGYIEAIASSCKPVLITGESGTGKELFARAVHQVSGRSGKFVPVNVGGLDDAVFSDTLFGHRKGAFTGANTDRRGLIEEACDGTLFLDEIGSLEKSSQIKLLRLLQENEYYPLGSDICKTSHVAIVAATNEDLQARMKDGIFRNDLFYRLLTHHIQIPPLRERREDIPALFEHFIAGTAVALGKPRPEIAPELIHLLDQYGFPGNVRELQALVFDAMSRCQSSGLDSAYFRDYIAGQTGKNIAEIRTEPRNQITIPYHGEFPKLREVEEFLVAEALKKAEGSQYAAAELLGVAQSTVWRRFKK
jgi:DNA-binding NtrC family response regulator